MRVSATVLLGCCLLCEPMGAQQRSPVEGGFTRSIGQPRPWKWSAGLAAGRSKGEVTELLSATEARLGAYHDLMNPVIGVAGLNVEGYLGTRGKKMDGGLRAHVASPALRIGVGVDYNLKTNAGRADISYYHPFRRGGLFRDGSTLRLDLMPGKRPYIMLGFDKPIARLVPTGKTRPRSDRATLIVGRAPPTPAPGASVVARLAPHVARARAAAVNIRKFNVPFLDHPAANRRQDEKQALANIETLQRDLKGDSTTGDAPFRTMAVEVRRMHAATDLAFSQALADTLLPLGTPTAAGGAVALEARRVILAEVLLPYDHMLGQYKKHDTTRQFANRARGIFLKWLHVDSKIAEGKREAVEWVFTALLDVIEENRAASLASWGDARFVWLPLQYALTEDQHDSQRKLDSLIEQAVDQKFTEGNQVSYVVNEQFQYQLSQTIKHARNYHVLWVHDFRGFDVKGDPDEMSFSHVMRSYLAALTARVREYDRTGTFPVYMIFLDQFFYYNNGGRLWMDLLEDPTRHQVHLPSTFKLRVAWEDSIKAAQDSLCAAIAGSKLMQSQRGQFGDEWIRGLVKVQVNITNVADQSFWSWTLIKGIATPDNMMRDHRKVAFYDITESDPYRGEAIYTGAGVGEHYSNLSWEDRALIVRGPAALALKTAAREALLQQGYRSGDIPTPLHAVEKSRDYDSLVVLAGNKDQKQFRALGLHNQTGFDDKEINVAKAILYTLMPPGSVIKVPDSLWNSAFWGSALIGAALRGVRVLVIAPSFDNAPARFFGGMVRSQEVLSRMITVSRVLAPNIAQAGGLLKVGLYSSKLQVTDIAGKMRAISETFSQQPWLRDLFDFPPAVYPEFMVLATTLDSLKRLDSLNAHAAGLVDITDFESSDSLPKLHLKANFFASQEGWRVMARREWMGYLRQFMIARSKQLEARKNAVSGFEEYPNAKLEIDDAALSDWFRQLAVRERERVVYYTIMGSQNQNARSMVTDGEDAFIVSNWIPVVPYLDLITLVGQSRWVQDTNELYALIPTYSTWKRQLAHWGRLAF